MLACRRQRCRFRDALTSASATTAYPDPKPAPGIERGRKSNVSVSMYCVIFRDLTLSFSHYSARGKERWALISPIRSHSFFVFRFCSAALCLYTSAFESSEHCPISHETASMGVNQSVAMKACLPISLFVACHSLPYVARKQSQRHKRARLCSSNTSHGKTFLSFLGVC